LNENIVNHLSENEIALLVAGGCPAGEWPRFATHLRECESCLDDLAFAARVHAGGVAYAGEIPELADLMRMAGVPNPSARKSGPGWKFPLIAGGGLAAAVVAVLLLLPSDPYPRPGNDERAIHVAMTRMSSYGYLVLPSTESRINPRPSTMRSGPWTRASMPSRSRRKMC